jgi:hypothetical protein
VLGHELVDEIVAGVLTSVGHEMRGKPAWMVLELLMATLDRRLPGIGVDDEAMRLAAARISAGLSWAPAPGPQETFSAYAEPLTLSS